MVTGLRLDALRGTEALARRTHDHTDNALGADTVDTTQLVDAAVATAKIEDGAVTLAKLAAAVQDLLVPTGTIAMFGASSAPTAWLLCDGSAVSRTTYADLFSVIGTTFGAGDGSTTFNVPDMVGNFPRGAGTVGATGGTSNHTHPLDSSTSHAKATVHEPFGAQVSIERKSVSSWTSTHSAGVNSAGTSSFSASTGTALGGDTEQANNMPPYLRLAFIIKT